MNDSTQQPENRQHQRILFKTPVQIIINGEKYESTAIDVSLKGALVQTPADWNAAPGDEGILQIKLNDSQTIIEMKVKLSHSENEHTGFHCEHIDIDSITHLKRLVELNLGDEALLQRELSSMQY